MAPTLPTSLSPHICILSSPDVEELFEASSLPALSQTLQSFVPLPQVTTRTTSLASIPHSSFALRFSDLHEIESATHEDEEQRAGRMMDWIGSRLSMRAPAWVQMLDAQAAANQEANVKESIWNDKTPWWEEVKRCVEGDHVPSTDEGWNHPVAVIMAVTTRAANPLQALQDLNSLPVDFPPWVDRTYLRYYLIIHPAKSPLADPIAEALFNAVKKQYGLHSYLLPLALPTDPFPTPVPVPSLPPRLPPPPSVTYETPPLAPAPTPAALSVPSTPRLLMSPAPRSPGPSMLMGRQPSASSPAPTGGHTLRLSEGDIQQTGKFVREFVVMSLVPWMEKCVIDWNENVRHLGFSKKLGLNMKQFSSSRRLPSRLFSSTRRLFGSSNVASSSSIPATPVHGSNPSISSISSKVSSHAPSNSVSSVASVSSIGTIGGGIVTQQRRLAEFATVLGDYKLATTVWENLRKEGRGGSDILPLLLSPSPALALHVAHAITLLHSLSPHAYGSPAHAQLRALSFAVRWAIGIDKRDFLSAVLEGERWLVQAAAGVRRPFLSEISLLCWPMRLDFGSKLIRSIKAEEPPATALLAHAAFLSEKKGVRRRSALWYLSAGDKFEKSGHKPLAMYFFRKAHELYKTPHTKQISPSFWESEGVDHRRWKGFESVLPGIEHELGRLLYTTGDTEGAVRYFTGLLRKAPLAGSITSLDLMNGSGSTEGQISADKVYLEDFRVALKHFRTTEQHKWEASSLQLPVMFCQARQTRVRLPNDITDGDPSRWAKLEDDWSNFWASRGKEKLERNCRAAVDEHFWVDIAMQNPLDVEVSLSELSVIVKEAVADETKDVKDIVDVEIVDEILLGAREMRTIPIAIKCRRPASLLITHVTYSFLSLLPAKESLAVRGRRLHDTPQQRQNKAYAPDVVIKVNVEEAGQRLFANFVDDRHLVLAHGEHKRLKLWLSNSGSKKISELWLVTGTEDGIWVNDDSSKQDSLFQLPQSEVLHSHNSLAPGEPIRLPLTDLHGSSELAPGENLQFSVTFHASQMAEQDLCFLFIFRESESMSFRYARAVRHYEVRPILKVVAHGRPSEALDQLFALSMEVENVTGFTGIQLSQLTTVSPMWLCNFPAQLHLGKVLPHQITRLTLGIRPWQKEVESIKPISQFVAQKLQAVVQGNQPDSTNPPSVDLLCSHITATNAITSVSAPPTCHFMHSGKRAFAFRATTSSHPHIPANSLKSIFPLYNPYTIDIMLFWEIPSENRHGHILVPGLILGASHAPLKEILEDAESAKVKRSMYAETQRERVEILKAIRGSEWNLELDPVVVTTESNDIVNHDFSIGPCSVPVAFTLRNYSPTNPCRVVMKFDSKVEQHNGHPLRPRFAGRLTHRATLEALESVIFKVKVWVDRPGNFVLDGWTVETEVGEQVDSRSLASANVWRSRHLHYLQGPYPGSLPCVTVVGMGHSL
ncbi:uncharacterized protein FIBRA_07387 [Fibroporia radiculosa]|uniref:TPPC8 first Ig-like domain-containing protein n=1 Tax=Fibroporia radiculosa TaxID=599839 RepID=J4GEA4_9APHY|nr:uncharacterized protein FIBRA_07387 [Fibroporia radiculosa]CCM05178.1 predicted protein [Fibroporia radiculosa]